MLAVNCDSLEQAKAVGAHFKGKSIVLSDGFNATLDGGHAFTDGNNHWLTVVPPGCGTSGVLPELEDRFNELAAFLYDILKTAPPYRYALVEVEAESYRDYDELLEEGQDAGYNGLVVSDKTWDLLGGPEEYEFFSPGYKWIPSDPWKAHRD
jgi:hypothetical protein